MTKKAIIVCGPTATGKTKLGIELAKNLESEIISADSRQVYKGMDLGTGKGISNFEFRISNFSNKNQNLGYYQAKKTRIWGYDLADPNSDFSVAEYRNLMFPVMTELWSQSKIPIIVGGTGFYINALVNPPETLGVPQNLKLRQELDLLTVDQLQAKLKKIDHQKFMSMNSSDQANPRRLIRAMEVADFKSRSRQINRLRESETPPIQAHWFGLKSDNQTLLEKVTQNVQSRATKQFTQEIKQLEDNNFDWTSKAASSTGYQEWKSYLTGKITKDEAISKWILREHQYQKRQLTWFNKNKQIHWFDIKTYQPKDLVAKITSAC